MQISSNIFIGAYSQRKALSSVDFFKAKGKNEAVISDKVAKAMQEIKRQNNKTATVSLSEESKNFLCSEDGYNKMKQDIENLYTQNALQQKELAKNSPEDPFWSNTGNQWLVFSENLYKNGFYDNMTDDEVKEAETILARITAGMDHLSRTQYDTGIEFSDFYGHGANYFMTSNEVIMELESATAALRYFSEKYVGEDQKEGFDDLVDKFYSHNTQVIEGYQSPIESFNKAINRIHTGKYNNSAVDNRYSQGMRKESSNIGFSIYLGGIAHSEKEKEAYRKGIASLFEEMDSSNSDEVWKNINEIFLNFSTENSDDKKIRDFITDQTKFTFARMKGYWSELLKTE